MSTTRRLRVKWWGRWEKMLDLNQAEPLIPFGHKALAVIIEGQYINSYEELVKIATSEEHKDKEFLDVAIIMPIIGG